MLLDSDNNRIRLMIQAAEQAVEYARQRTQSQAESEPPLQHLFIRNLEILGEAASRVSAHVRQAHPEIPWRDMVDMRNRLIHAYFDIDMDIVWKTVQQALPNVLTRLRAILDTETPP